MTFWSAARDLLVTILLSLVGAFVLFAASKPASAESVQPWDGDEPPNGRPFAIQRAWAACADDARRYCSTVVPGGGRIVACLAGNKDRLGPQCRDVIRHVEALFGR
jgi:hypothetical protein